MKALRATWWVDVNGLRRSVTFGEVMARPLPRVAPALAFGVTGSGFVFVLAFTLLLATAFGFGFGPPFFLSRRGIWSRVQEVASPSSLQPKQEYLPTSRLVRT